MPIFRDVFARLQEDDSILALSDTEFLEVELSRALTGHAVDDLAPVELRRQAAAFVRRLREAAGTVAGEPYLPDPRNPNGCCRFRKGEDVVVAFHGDSPVWYWRREQGLWELHMMRVTRISDLAGTPDLVASPHAPGNSGDDRDEGDVRARPCQIEPREERIEDRRASSGGGPETGDEAADDGNDPERLTPDALLGVLMHFTQVLGDAHDRLEGAPWLPDTANPNGKRRFRSNGEFIVSCRDTDGTEYEPAWCWRRKPDGHWKLYRLRTRAGPEIPDPSVEHRLGDGRWN